MFYIREMLFGELCSFLGLLVVSEIDRNGDRTSHALQVFKVKLGCFPDGFSEKLQLLRAFGGEDPRFAGNSKTVLAFRAGLSREFL